MWFSFWLRFVGVVEKVEFPFKQSGDRVRPEEPIDIRDPAAVALTLACPACPHSVQRGLDIVCPAVIFHPGIECLVARFGGFPAMAHVGESVPPGDKSFQSSAFGGFFLGYVLVTVLTKVSVPWWYQVGYRPDTTPRYHGGNTLSGGWYRGGNTRWGNNRIPITSAFPGFNLQPTGLFQSGNFGRHVVPVRPHGFADRVNLTVKMSYDECASWPVSKVVDAGPSGYSDLAVAADGSILCFYERRPTDEDGVPWHLSLARFNLEWLAEGAEHFRR